MASLRGGLISLVLKSVYWSDGRENRGVRGREKLAGVAWGNLEELNSSFSRLRLASRSFRLCRPRSPSLSFLTVVVQDYITMPRTVAPTPNIPPDHTVRFNPAQAPPSEWHEWSPSKVASIAHLESGFGTTSLPSRHCVTKRSRGRRPDGGLGCRVGVLPSPRNSGGRHLEQHGKPILVLEVSSSFVQQYLGERGSRSELICSNADVF